MCAHMNFVFVTCIKCHLFILSGHGHLLAVPCLPVFQVYFYRSVLNSHSWTEAIINVNWPASETSQARTEKGEGDPFPPPSQFVFADIALQVNVNKYKFYLGADHLTSEGGGGGGGWFWKKYPASAYA